MKITVKNSVALIVLGLLILLFAILRFSRVIPHAPTYYGVLGNIQKDVTRYPGVDWTLLGPSDTIQGCKVTKYTKLHISTPKRFWDERGEKAISTLTSLVKRQIPVTVSWKGSRSAWDPYGYEYCSVLKVGIGLKEAGYNMVGVTLYGETFLIMFIVGFGLGLLVFGGANLIEATKFKRAARAARKEDRDRCRRIYPRRY